MTRYTEQFKKECIDYINTLISTKNYTIYRAFRECIKDKGVSNGSLKKWYHGSLTKIITNSMNSNTSIAEEQDIEINNSVPDSLIDESKESTQNIDNKDGLNNIDSVVKNLTDEIQNLKHTITEKDTIIAEKTESIHKWMARCDELLKMYEKAIVLTMAK